MLLELNSKGLYQSSGKEKETCCFANINLVLLGHSCSRRRRRRRCQGKPRNTLCLLSSTAYLFNQNLTYVFTF